MDKIWTEMYDAAKKVQRGRRISEYIEAGEVAAAVLSTSGKIYTRVVDLKLHDTCYCVDVII